MAGHFYPAPPIFIGGAQPFAPKLGLPQSGPAPQPPPLRGALALANLAIILASWQQPFLESQGAGEIAPVIQQGAVAAQPPIPSSVNLSTVVRSWEFTPTFVGGDQPYAANVFLAQSGPAPAVQPPIGNPRALSVIDATWRLDPSTSIQLCSVAPFITNVAVSQPAPASFVNVQIILRAWDAPAQWSQQYAADIAPNLPRVDNAPALSQAVRRVIAQSWDPPPWLQAQGAGDSAPLIPAAAAPSAPPATTTANLGIVLASWAPGYFQLPSAADIAPMLLAPVAAPPLPIYQPTWNVIARSWDPIPYSPTQGAGDIAPDLPRVDAPPNSSAVNLKTAIDQWTLRWTGPGQVNVAPLLPQPIAPSQPPVVSSVNLAIALSSWMPAFFEAQGFGEIAPVLPAIAPTAPLPVYPPTWSIIARSWDAIPFARIQGSAIAPLVQASANVLPQSGLSLQIILAQWQAQPASIERQKSVAAILATPPVISAPPVTTYANFNVVMSQWAPPWQYDQRWHQYLTNIFGPPVVEGGPRYVVKLRYRLFTVSATMGLEFEDLAPGEEYPLTFDFSPDLDPGEQLAGTPMVSIAMEHGYDLSPALLQNGTAGTNAEKTKVIVPVHGRNDGGKYAITVKVATTNPQKTLVLTGILPVVA